MQFWRSSSGIVERIIGISFRSTLSIIKGSHIPFPIELPAIDDSFSQIRVGDVKSSKADGIAKSTSNLLYACFFVKAIVIDQQS